MQLVPLGTIPALRVGDEYFSESDVIMEYLEDAYPAHSLLTNDHLKKPGTVFWPATMTSGWNLTCAVRLPTAIRPPGYRLSWMIT